MKNNVVTHLAQKSITGADDISRAVSSHTDYVDVRFMVDEVVFVSFSGCEEYISKKDRERCPENTGSQLTSQTCGGRMRERNRGTKNPCMIPINFSARRAHRQNFCLTSECMRHGTPSVNEEVDA